MERKNSVGQCTPIEKRLRESQLNIIVISTMVMRTMVSMVNEVVTITCDIAHIIFHNYNVRSGFSLAQIALLQFYAY